VVCGEATNGENAVREVAKLLPDVILLDLSIPLLHGLRVAKILKRDYPTLVVIVMSEQDISVLSRYGRCSGNSVLHTEIPRGAGFDPHASIFGAKLRKTIRFSGRTKRTARASQ
jgi:CheY-like chemotaxis protein